MRVAAYEVFPVLYAYGQVCPQDTPQQLWLELTVQYSCSAKVVSNPIRNSA
jgi:hypothetical protein